MMKTQLEVISPVKRKILVEVEPAEVTRKLEDAYRSLAWALLLAGDAEGAREAVRAGRTRGFEPPRDLLEALDGGRPHPLSYPQASPPTATRKRDTHARLHRLPRRLPGRPVLPAGRAASIRRQTRTTCRT